MVTIRDAKPFIAGNSYVITIPKHFINNGQIDPEKSYSVELTENTSHLKNSVSSPVFKSKKKAGGRNVRVNKKSKKSK